MNWSGPKQLVPNRLAEQQQTARGRLPSTFVITPAHPTILATSTCGRGIVDPAKASARTANMPKPPCPISIHKTLLACMNVPLNVSLPTVKGRYLGTWCLGLSKDQPQGCTRIGEKIFQPAVMTCRSKHARRSTGKPNTLSLSVGVYSYIVLCTSILSGVTPGCPARLVSNEISGWDVQSGHVLSRRLQTGEEGRVDGHSLALSPCARDASCTSGSWGIPSNVRQLPSPKTPRSVAIEAKPCGISHDVPYY